MNLTLRRIFAIRVPLADPFIFDKWEVVIKLDGLAMGTHNKS